MAELNLGKIVNTYGLNGELKLLTDPLYGDLEFKKNAEIKIANKVYRLRNYRRNKNLIRFSLVEHEDINAVEALIGETVMIDSSELKKLNEDEFYSFELLGFDVVDESGNDIGKIIRIKDSGWQKILRIKGSQKKDILIPWVAFFVKEIDRERQTVRVETIEGLI